MTPRQLAEQHLPELAESFDPLRTTFAAKLVGLQVSGTDWIAPPDWTTWPSTRLDELHPLAEPEQPRPRARVGRRK
jgi:hypothetical protein